jgi:hypothetical protein
LLVILILLTLLGASELRAQTSSDEPGRIAEIQAERASKARDLQPDEPTKVENYVIEIEKVMKRSPIRLVGGLGPGSGLTVGSVLERNNSSDSVRTKLWGVGSIRKFYNVGTGLEFPHAGVHGLSFALDGSHTDAPQIDYYGPGPDSSIDNRTDFRREETLFGSRVHFAPLRSFSTGCRLGAELLNVGPGTNGDVPTTESVFGPAEAPGINVQSNYVIAGCSLQVDRRDFPGDPHEGTFAAAVYDRYAAYQVDQFSFHRLSAVAEHYIPFLNQKRVIALRAKTDLSFHSERQVVPFYLQATLGSDSDLRGFRAYRFYDENSLVLNAEYRWEVSARFDAALFVDSGKVFHRPREISLSGMDTSAGFGFRFKSLRDVALRIDTGCSREGCQVWVRFGKLL